MRRRHLALLLCLCCSLSGCSLLPAEPTIRNVPIIQEHTPPVYDLVQVQRGDLKLEHTIGCEYISTKIERLRFPVADIPFTGIYVAKGDSVQKGQLVAQLDMQGYDIQLESYLLELERLELDFAAIEENRALALERKRLQMAGQSQAQIDQACGEVNAQYDRRKQTLLEELHILELKIEACQEQISMRRLYAPFDGIVSFADTMTHDKVSKAGNDVVRITDPAVSSFRLETRHWQLFHPGDILPIYMSQYTIAADGTPSFSTVSLDARVVTEAELGLPEADKKEGFSAKIYLKPVDPLLEASDKNPYYISLVEASREDVLLLPRNAVSYVDGQTVVYCVDENNMRYYRTVEVGLSANGFVEIVSGLAEGDSVIDL